MQVPYDDDIEDIRYNGDINLRQRLSSDWMKMLLNDSFNDVCIKLHDGEVFANKVVLSARSEYFAASLRWKENNKEKNEKQEIILENCSMKIMALVIEYFYSGVLRVNDLDIMELLELREQVRLLLPGDKLHGMIADLIMEERFTKINMLELFDLREKLKTVLPTEEFLIKDFISIVDERDKNFFLTNEEILTLTKSDEIRDRQRKIEICELFDNDFSNSDIPRAHAMRASLVFHGVLKTVEELIISAESISLIPEDQLKTLVSSTTKWIEIYDDNISEGDRDIIFTNVRSKEIEIVDLFLSKRETELLVRAMGSGVEEIKLEGELDLNTFLTYQGNGTCKLIFICEPDFTGKHEQELLAWCKRMNWSMTDKKGDTHQSGTVYGIELKRKDK